MSILIVLTENYSGKKWSLDGEEYSGLNWFDSSPKPTEEELLAQVDEATYKAELERVKAARHAAYTAPNGSDAVFMKYQRGEATEQEWLDAVQAINDAHPYPEEIK